jgi:hypothetical protein
MVQRLSVAGLDSGAESPVYGEEPLASADRDPGGKPPWTGDSGHWTVWPMRVGPWQAILIIGHRGVTAILFDETPSGGSGTGNDTTGPTASGFFVTLGEPFPMRFGQIYLNYRPSTAAQRAQHLVAFIVANVRTKDPQFGWNGSGISVTQSTEVAGIDARSADTAVVTLLTSVNGQPKELGGPPRATDGRLAVSGQPAWLPAPPVAAVSRYLAPGASISGIGGAVSYDGVTSLHVPPGGATRDTTVTVNWTIPDQVGTGAPRLVTSYDMSVVDQQSGRWYVKDIRASTQLMGTS